MDAAGLADLFAPVGPVTIKRMFGGFGVFRGERMFALAAGGEVYVKASQQEIPELEAAGSRPFSFERKDRRSGTPRRMVTSYWLLPAEAFDDGEVLKHWAGRALAAAATRD